MFNIIPPLLIVLGLAGLIIIFNRKDLKEIKMIEENQSKIEITQRYSAIFTKWHQLFNKQNFELIQTKLSNFFNKVLIRLRIVILRLDHFLFRQLEKRKGVENANKDNQDLKKNDNNLSALNKKFSFELDNLNSLSSLDLEKEEKKLLKLFFKKSLEESSLINLARLYLYKKDFSSARWALLEAYRLNPKDKVIRDLLSELQEKEMAL
ncbi:MAG: hypothetical protein ACP5RX_01170 [Minisyncoccia bacterium]